MPGRRTVARLAVDSRLLELHIICFKAPPLAVFQLTGVTHGAIGMVARCGAERFPRACIRALALRGIDELPEIEPAFMQRVVLNRKYVNLTVRQLRGIGLLPFVTNDVVDRVASPAPAGLPDLKVMPPAVDEHPRK